MTEEYIEKLKREVLEKCGYSIAAPNDAIARVAINEAINLLSAGGLIVQEGMVQVPLEPTEAMKVAGFKAGERQVGCSNYHLNGICDHCGHGFDKPDGCGHQAVASYKAMIAAAPKAEQSWVQYIFTGLNFGHERCEPLKQLLEVLNNCPSGQKVMLVQGGGGENLYLIVNRDEKNPPKEQKATKE